MIRTLFAESEAATIVSLVWRRSVDGREEAQAVVEEKEPGWAPPSNLMDAEQAVVEEKEAGWAPSCQPVATLC